MRLLEKNKLSESWNYSLKQGANVILMRHAPKSGSDESGLSEEGVKLAREYGKILKLNDPLLICTSKQRTLDTINLLFPSSLINAPLILPDLEVNKVSSSIDKQCKRLHAKIGHFRRYYLNHTYYFLEKLGGTFGDKLSECNLHTTIAERMVRGIKLLFSYGKNVVYCGHSPIIEVGLEKLFGLSLSELGGFLNPLDSIHLRKKDNRIEWIARINPIVDYVDLESETHFK